MKDTNCPYKCNDKHEVFMSALNAMVPCPHCKDVTTLIKKQEEDENFNPYEKLYIPKQYKDAVAVDIDLFPTEALGAFSPDSINEVSQLLFKINQSLYKSRIFDLSTYIYVPNIVDIKLFVYGAQRLAVENGLSVTPFISANTLCGIQRVGEFSLTSIRDVKDMNGDLKDVHPDLLNAVDGYRVIQDTDLTYYDFINADLCFIDATANTTEKGWTGVADLLNERTKKGRPTYVIGYWGTKNAQYAGMNGLKYLTVPKGVMPRLDLLVPVEIKPKSKNGKVEFSNTKISIDKAQTTEASASAGLTLESFMG